MIDLDFNCWGCMPNELDQLGVLEALQTRLLVELMSNSMHRELTLKGGMAMRAIHGSHRYTQDIDLDADETASTQRISGVVKRSIERAINSGLIDQATFTTPKQTGTMMRWKIAGFVPGGTAPMNLTVEVSRRPKIVEGHVQELPLNASFGLHGASASGVRVRVLDNMHIAVSKVLALTDLNRTAPRDLYDLDVLIEAGVEDPGLLLAEMNDAKTLLPQIMTELWPKIEAMTYAQFSAQVVPYLPLKIGEAIDQDAFDGMCLNVGAAVESWIETAKTSPKFPSELLDRPAPVEDKSVEAMPISSTPVRMKKAPTPAPTKARAAGKLKPKDPADE